MAERIEALFERLQSREEVHSLLGQAETAELEFKAWYDRSAARNGHIAKAACGFANADGGVIVFGVKAFKGSDDIDVAKELVPVENMGEVVAEVLDVTSRLWISQARRRNSKTSELACSFS